MENYTKKRFFEKVIIITGGASGIGKEVALRASMEGAKIIIVDLNEEKGQEVEKEIKSNGSECMFQKVDLTDEHAVENMIAKSVEAFQKVDILINNAGISSEPTPLHLLDLNILKHVMECNFYSVFYCSKYFINQVLQQKEGACIVNTASISGILGIPKMLPYVSSKHAINGLTKNMAIDYAKYGIRVNSVNPYTTATPMGTAGMKKLEDSAKKAKEAGIDLSKVVIPGLKQGNLQNRNASAGEQASSILYLASDDASHITGTIFQTDGGYSTF